MSSFLADEVLGNYTYIRNTDELKHLKVKRIKIGEPVSLIDGKGSLFLTHLEKIDGRGAKFLIEKTIKEEFRVDKTFFIGITDRRKMEFIAEKAGEMGVKKFGFFFGDKTEKHIKLPEKKKILKKVVSGMKQSDNPNFPCYLGIARSMEEIIFDGLALILTPEGERAFSDLNSKDVKNVVIGPKEGFSHGEMMKLKEQNVLFANFGNTIYRVETAFIIVSYLLKS